jgi:hypothetical protein
MTSKPTTEPPPTSAGSMRVSSWSGWGTDPIPPSSWSAVLRRRPLAGRPAPVYKIDGSP